MSAITLILAATACAHSVRHQSGSTTGTGPLSARTVEGVRFVPVLHQRSRPGSDVQKDCRRTATAVGFPVPCPRLLPAEAQPTSPGPACPTRYVAMYIHPACVGHGLAFLSVEWPANRRVGHLVISATQRAFEPRRAIAAPVPPVATDTVQIMGATTVRGRHALWLKIPGISSSAYGGHTVLFWKEGGHSYLVGFHGHDPAARSLDVVVARTLILVRP